MSRLRSYLYHVLFLTHVSTKNVSRGLEPRWWYDVSVTSLRLSTCLTVVGAYSLRCEVDPSVRSFVKTSILVLLYGRCLWDVDFPGHTNLSSPNKFNPLVSEPISEVSPLSQTRSCDAPLNLTVSTCPSRKVRWHRHRPPSVPRPKPPPSRPPLTGLFLREGPTSLVQNNYIIYRIE